LPKRYVIIANGEMSDYDWYRRQLRPDDFILCADGGSRHALNMGVTPHLVLGDFDSIPPEVRQRLVDGQCPCQAYPGEKDATDTEIALEWCLTQAPEEILFLGVLGSRLDHTLANVFLLAKVPEGIPARIIDRQNEAFLVRQGISLAGLPGDNLSILCLDPLGSGVSTRGLKYILREDILNFGSSRGVSNQFVREEVSVTLESGWALVIQSWDQPRD